MNTRLLTGLVLVVLLLRSTCLYAESVADNARLDTLANSPTWHKLIKYEADGNGWLSAIHSPGFFLAPDGNRNPRAELLATLAALQLPSDQNQDDHAQCRFRGRWVWLQQQGLLVDSERQPCPAFERFTSANSVQSVSLVLATGYLGNPASFYGHTLLKLNSPAHDNRSVLLDQTVNYGAIIPDGEDPVSYIIKGVGGLYDAGFTHIQYYYHDHSYGETQLRDQWEYELELTQPEVDLVVAHAWEVLGQKYDYYFFTRNCAYRMAEVVEVVDGVHIIPDRTFMIPQTYLQQLELAERNGKPLLRARYYHASRQARLYQRFAILDNEARNWVEQAVGQGDALDYQTLPGFAAADPVRQRRTVDALLDYYQFRELAELDDEEQQRTAKAPAYTASLRQRYRLPPGAPDPIVAPESGPEEGRLPGLLRSGWMRDANGDGAFSLLLRPSYYDALDADVGHVRDGKLVMGELGAYLYPDHIELDHFDAVAIESVNRSTTGLPGDRGHAWRLQAGWTKLDRRCDACLVPRLLAQTGVARPWASQHLIAGAYIGAAVQQGRGDYGYGVVAGTLFSNLHLGTFSARLELNDYYQLNSALDHEFETRLQGRYRTGQEQEVRLSWLHQRGHTLELGYGIYW